MKRKDLHKLFLMCICCLGSMTAIAQSASWQQHLEYDIDVKLDVKKKTIAGDIVIQYTNNSPDTLSEIYMHLWPNAYQNTHTAWAKQAIRINMLDFQYDNKYGRIDSLNFKVNGNNALMASQLETPDIIRIIPQDPIQPGETVSISTPFRTKLTPFFSRSGYNGSFFAATQWYPKPAVYDQKGWHPMSYLDQGEFYSEFGNFKVKITLPSTYILAATGYATDTIITDTTPGALKTIEILQNKVHDFAWFASPKAKFKSEIVELPSGKKVLSQIFFFDPKLESKGLEYNKLALSYMSEWVGEYPYDISTIVEGPAGSGAGMEYPTICTVGGGQLLEETVHEVAHNWWYGILANNERRDPWLDESITSYYESRMIETIGGGMFEKMDSLRYRFFAKALSIDRIPENFFPKMSILMQQRLNQQQAMTSESEDLTWTNYYAMLYAKGPVAWKWLENAMGIEVFDKSMQTFYERFAFKHFDAKDLQSVFEEVSGKDLKWFFEGVANSAQNQELKLKKVKKQEATNEISISNNTEFTFPVPVSYTSKAIKADTTIWLDIKPGLNTYTILAHNTSDLLALDPNWETFDNNRSNNYYKLNKAFPKFEPIRLQFIGAPEDPTRDPLYIAPVMGGNHYDGYMLGVALYNRVFPAKKFEFEFVPMYAFRSKQFNWIGNASYHISPKSQKPLDIEAGIHSKSFSINDFIAPTKFYKLQPFVKLTFDKSKGDERPSHTLTFRHVQIWEQAYNYLQTIDKINIFEKNTTGFCTNELNYTVQYKHALFPFRAATRLEFNKNYVKQSVEWAQKFRYNKKGSMISVRLFSGAFLFRNDDVSFRLNKRFGYNLSGVSGRNDYLYDYTYLGRSENSGFLSQQIAMGEGNFKVITPLNNIQEGQTVNWLMAANFKVDFPIKKIPIKLFADLGYSVDKNLNIQNVLPVKQFHYDLGLALSVFDEAVEVYFPFLMSQNFRDYYKSNLPKFGQKITFMVDLGKLNIHQKIRNLSSDEFPF